MKPSTDASNLQLIQENMYALYKMTPADLDLLLGQTYHRKESGADWSQESYACVVHMAEEGARRLDNSLYNELELTLSGGQCIKPSRQLSLALYTEDFDSWWTAYIPYTGQDLFLLWSSIVAKITPTIDQLWTDQHENNWYAFTHKYFLQITKELGATEYDYG